MTRQFQKLAVLHRLKQGPATTWALIQLGICCPTKRISELRKDGFEIVTSEKRGASGKRIVTYTLKDSPAAAEPQNERVNGLGERVGECSNCHGPVYRKPKARLPLPGEEIFCKGSCRDEYWNKRKKQQAELFTDRTGNPQDLQTMGNGAP